MNSAKASTSTPQRPARTATRLRTRRGLSGSGKKSSSRLTGTVSERLSQETDDKLKLDGGRQLCDSIQSPVIRQPRTVFLDVDEGSPVRIPNSQAPIPGRDVFWNLDTPETKRNRDALYQKMAAQADSPVLGSRVVSLTPKLKLIPRKREELDPDRGADARIKGLAALDALMNLQETADRDDDEDEEESNHLHLSKSPRTEVSPQNRSENGSPDSGDMFDEDFDDADDEILLLATQQPIEEGISVKTPSPCYSGYLQPEPKPPTPLHEGASATTKAVGDNIDDLFGDDDELDDVMSQMEMPEVAPAPKVSQPQFSASSLTLAPPLSTSSSNKSVAQGSGKPRTPNVRNSNFAIKGFESEFDDSFDNVLSQIEVPTMAPLNRNLPTQAQGAGKTSGPHTSTQKPSPLAAKTPVIQQKPKLTFQFPPKKNSLSAKENVSEPSNSLVRSGGGGPVRKFSSFNSPPREKKLIAKFKSDPLIPNKPICSKEEIERKKKEALARKQMLHSQKQQRN